LEQLGGAGLQTVLLRTAEVLRAIDVMREEVAELRSINQDKTENERRYELLRLVQDAISAPDGAQSQFRSVTLPASTGRDDAAIGEARAGLVGARVGLEARTKEVSDPHVRAKALAYVQADEKQDRALRDPSLDRDTFDAVREATINAYREAQDATATAISGLRGT
jgi:hypothetical protein